jgi:hypothetical protein
MQFRLAKNGGRRAKPLMINIKSARNGGFLDAPKGILYIGIMESREGKIFNFRKIRDYSNP